MSNSNTPSFYAIIPAHVRYCKELEPSAKLLYAEIVACLDCDGYCWEKSKYFSERFKVDQRTICRWLKSLKDKGFIDSYIEKEGIESSRKIWLKGVFHGK